MFRIAAPFRSIYTAYLDIALLVRFIGMGKQAT